MGLIANRGVFEMFSFMPDSYTRSRFMTLKPEELRKIRGLSRAAKCEVGQWIISCLQMLLAEQRRYDTIALPTRRHGLLMIHGYRYAQNNWSNMDPSVLLSPTQVAFIRQVLEEIGDIAALVEVSVGG